jgi:hypothetical protein
LRHRAELSSQDRHPTFSTVTFDAPFASAAAAS